MYCFIVAGRIPSETEMSSNHNKVLSPSVRDNTSWALPLPPPIQIIFQQPFILKYCDQNLIMAVNFPCYTSFSRQDIALKVNETVCLSYPTIKTVITKQQETEGKRILLKTIKTVSAVSALMVSFHLRNHWLSYAIASCQLPVLNRLL